MDFRTKEFTVSRLQDELRKRNLKQYGKKAELVERLEEFEGISPAPDGDEHLTPIERRRRDLSKLRSRLSIWTSPISIFKFFFMYLAGAIADGLKALFSNSIAVFLLIAAISTVVAAYVVDGSHTELLRKAEIEFVWYGWWFALGVASSIGLGTGLHTFVLFLGPHIAQVTIAANQCQSVDFDERGPFRYVCRSTPAVAAVGAVSLLSIFNKIRWECFFWGFGTSVGELPPYFVARAAAAAGKDDADFNGIERILEKNPSERSLMEKGQVAVFELVQKLGFYGIVLCASIPNPLFDLAGIICGHFGVPFLTFWGATFVGKALIKNHIQSFAIILLFSEDILKWLLEQLHLLWPWLHGLAKQFLEAQVNQFKSAEAEKEEDPADGSFFVPRYVFSAIWNAVIGGMVLYFLLSLVEALAIQELKRQHDLTLAEEKSK